MRTFVEKFAAASEPGDEVKEFQGIDVVIEWPTGSTRTGVNDEGEPWERIMKADYGYIPGTVGGEEGDGEDLDVYIGPNPEAPEAFLIEQLDDEGELDEYKCMLGFNSEESAKSTYLEHYPKGWEDHVGDIWSTQVSRVKDLVEETVD